MALRRALHFVFKIGNRNETIKFYREILGMKVRGISYFWRVVSCLPMDDSVGSYDLAPCCNSCLLSLSYKHGGYQK